MVDVDAHGVHGLSACAKHRGGRVTGGSVWTPPDRTSESRGRLAIQPPTLAHRPWQPLHGCLRTHPPTQWDARMPRRQERKPARNNTLHSLQNTGSAIGSPPGQHECAFSPTSRTSHRIPRVTLRASAAIYMYWRRLGPGSDSRRGTSRVGESVYQAPVTAGSETSDRQLCAGRAGRAGEPRQLPAVILFTAGNFSISSFDSFRAAGFSAAPSLPALFGPTHRIPCVYVK